MNTYVDNRFLAADKTLVQYHGTEQQMVLPSRFGRVEVTTLGRGAVCSDELESLRLSEGYCTINDAAFKGCPSLKTLALPSTLQNLRSSALNYCPHLQTVMLRGLSFTENEYETLLKNSVAVGKTKRLAFRFPTHRLLTPLPTESFCRAGFIPPDFRCLFFSAQPKEKPLQETYRLLNTANTWELGSELPVLRNLILSRSETFFDSTTEVKNDEEMTKYNFPEPARTAVFTFDHDTVLRERDSVYVNAQLQIGYIFWQSLVSIADGGSDYFLYRRCYLCGEGGWKYLPVDVGIFDGSGAVVDENRAEEIYGKYELMRIL